jgi:hypothetical protein
MNIRDAEHNNGMHPTRDTLPLIYLQRLGRAGDAGRSAALWRNWNAQMFAGRILTAENSGD